MFNPCALPTPKGDVIGDNRWESMHKRYVQQAHKGESDVIFIGDSIIYQLQFSNLWNEKISLLHCLNFGIGGDRVENVLWRILNGELNAAIKPKAIVLFVGTNNTDCTSQQVFEGIVEIVRVIRGLFNNVHIIIPTLLPRGQNPNVLRERNEHVNRLLLDEFENLEGGETANTHNVHIVKIHERVVEGDQTISHHIMYDYLHLTDYGYKKTFEWVYQKLLELLSC